MSRATVYRYLGGKQDIVQAVIIREAAVILERAAAVITTAPTVERAIGEGIATILLGVDEHPLLSRLTTADLPDTLPHLTVDSAPLVAVGMEALGPAFRAASSYEIDDEVVDEAIEEAARFVFGHLTTPRCNGSRLPPDEAGRRAASLLSPLLSTEP